MWHFQKGGKERPQGWAANGNHAAYEQRAIATFRMLCPDLLLNQANHDNGTHCGTGCGRRSGSGMDRAGNHCTFHHMKMFCSFRGGPGFVWSSCHFCEFHFINVHIECGLRSAVLSVCWFYTDDSLKSPHSSVNVKAAARKTFDKIGSTVIQSGERKGICNDFFLEKHFYTAPLLVHTCRNILLSGSIPVNKLPRLKSGEYKRYRSK